MFQNIGAKIKTLAKVVCWLGIIASVIAGIVMIAGGMANGPATAVPNGILMLIGGPLVSWLSCFMTYGFGQMVENTDKLVAQMENKEGE